MAVPFAALLERSGLFDALAARIAKRDHGFLPLWILAVATTAILNLDVAVVVLTPLYLRLGRTGGGDPLVIAAMPAVAAFVASSFLPVSNLTNLIAVEQLGLTTAGFARMLWLPSIVAVIVAGWALKRRAPPPIAGPAPAALPIVPVVVAVVLALVAVALAIGPFLGVPAWAVVAIAVAALAARERHVPWRSIPIRLVVLVAALGTFVSVAADVVGLAPSGRTDSAASTAAVALAAAGAANVVNNLPAFLASMPLLAGEGCTAWPVLLGVNAGPGLALSGSLSTLLWASILRRDGLTDLRTRLRSSGRHSCHARPPCRRRNPRRHHCDRWVLRGRSRSRAADVCGGGKQSVAVPPNPGGEDGPTKSQTRGCGQPATAAELLPVLLPDGPQRGRPAWHHPSPGARVVPAQRR